MATRQDNRIPEFVSRHEDELAQLCRRHEVSRLELFGSAVTSAFDHTRSDLDFLVEFDWVSEPSEWLRIFFDFKTALEILFDRPVDLVSYRAIRNPYLIASIDERRTLLYAA
jgi:uncharacterized protein